MRIFCCASGLFGAAYWTFTLFEVVAGRAGVKKNIFLTVAKSIDILSGVCYLFSIMAVLFVKAAFVLPVSSRLQAIFVSQRNVCWFLLFGI